jgi:hypothetical protein
MPRKAATVEYLERLIDWAGGQAEFRRATGMHQSNLSDYLRSRKTVSWTRLKSATHQVFGQPPAFCPVIEGYDLYESGIPTLAELSHDPGIYALFDSAMRVIYFGKATDLYNEVRQTLRRSVAEVRPWTGAKNLRFRDIAAYLSAYKLTRSDPDFRHDVEAFGLRIMVNNTFNKKGAAFKRKA